MLLCKDNIVNKIPTLLLVDDNIDNLKVMERPLKKEGYKLIVVEDGKSAIKEMEKEQIDLILLDVMMPEISGFEVCETLKKNAKFQLIPIIMITSLTQMEDRIKSIEVGADDFLNKPFNSNELIARVRSLLRIKSLTDQLDSAESIILSLAEAVEARDVSTRGHTERVGKLAEAIGKKMGASWEKKEALRKGGIMHDIGKIGIRDHILGKPGKLNEEEFSTMKQHPAIGFEICKSLKSAKGILDLILHHHEKLDGSGYPHGLKGEEISLAIRILTVVDIYDAMITSRPYREGLQKDVAYATLDQYVATNHIDGKVVDCLKSLNLS